MKVIVFALLLIVAGSFAIDVDHDESDLAVGFFDFVKGEDPKKITPNFLKEKVVFYFDKEKDLVKRLLTNALNKEIMTPKKWNTWKEMVEGEATDVTNKVGQLEDFTAELKVKNLGTAQEIIKKAVVEYFNPIAEGLAKDPKVGVKHILPQQQ